MRLENTQNVEAIGQNIAYLRKSLGWTIKELSARAELSSRTIINLEKGRLCTFKALYKVSRALDIPYDVVCAAPGEFTKPFASGPWNFSNLNDAVSYYRSRQTLRTTNFQQCPPAIQNQDMRRQLADELVASTFFQDRTAYFKPPTVKTRLYELYGELQLGREGWLRVNVLVVISGSVEITLSGKTLILKEGDSHTYQALEPAIVRPQVAPARSKLPCLLFVVAGIVPGPQNN